MSADIGLEHTVNTIALMIIACWSTSHLREFGSLQCGRRGG